MKTIKKWETLPPCMTCFGVLSRRMSPQGVLPWPPSAHEIVTALPSWSRIHFPPVKWTLCSGNESGSHPRTKQSPFSVNSLIRDFHDPCFRHSVQHGRMKSEPTRTLLTLLLAGVISQSDLRNALGDSLATRGMRRPITPMPIGSRARIGPRKPGGLTLGLVNPAALPLGTLEDGARVATQHRLPSTRIGSGSLSCCF